MGSRGSENELGRAGLSCFRTPSKPSWKIIREKCRDHLRRGGSLAALPHANKIWMLFGFELFVEIIEVYPFAIVRALLPACRINLQRWLRAQGGTRANWSTN